MEKLTQEFQLTEEFLLNLFVEGCKNESSLMKKGTIKKNPKTFLQFLYCKYHGFTGEGYHNGFDDCLEFNRIYKKIKFTEEFCNALRTVE